jgi:hypothetical protein
MSVWKPKPVDNLRWDALQLSGEEGLVLSRLDGSTPAAQLTHVTGMPPTKVAAILDKLVDMGVVVGLDAPRAPAPTLPSMPAIDEPTLEDITGGDEAAAAAEALWEADELDEPSLPVVEEEEVANRDRRAAASDDDDGDDVDKNANDADTLNEADENNHRQVYQTEFAGLEASQREAAAKTASGHRLLALAFDPLAPVVAAVVHNQHAGFAAARLVARHHRTPQGLDAVLQRSEFARDAQVQRYVLQNPMAQDPHFKRLLGPKRLPALYQWCVDRELPERNRSKVKSVLRSKWAASPAEDRADLVLRTEGRVLLFLIGCTFDSHTSSLLCQRTMSSTMLIQNLCRFSATSPPILLHLSRQQVVRRNPQLKQMVMRHPNTPSEAKKG